MKKIYAFFLLLFVAVQGYAQGPDTADILLKHSVQTNDTIKIDSPTLPPPVYLRYDFVNLGPDSISSIDTLFLTTPYISIKLLLPAGYWNVGDTVFFLDTVSFTSGPANGPFNWCDSVWLKDTIGASGSPVYDPIIANNKTCNTVQIKHITTTGVSSNLNGTRNIYDQKLVIFPNPANNNASFNFNFPMTPVDASVTITDLVGRRVMYKDLGKMSGSSTISLDLGNINSGMYIVEMRTGKFRSVGKISIQK